VEARLFCIALYFKLRRGFRALAWDPLAHIEAISSFSDREYPSKAYFYSLHHEKMGCALSISKISKSA
jgi:hypothetical protein